MAQADEYRFAEAAPAQNYTVLEHLDIGNGDKGRVYVPRDPAKIKYHPDGGVDADLIAVEFRTYTLLAQNEQDQHVVCTGLKIDIPGDSELSFYAEQVEAGAFLYPSDSNVATRTEKSYGRCAKVDVQAGHDIMDSNVQVLTHGSREASFGVPIIIGVAEPVSVPDFNTLIGQHPLDEPRPACVYAGWNEEHAQAAEGQQIRLGFCP